MADQAEDLIRTLPGVVSVRVVDDPEGSIQEVHILTTSELSAKQTVRKRRERAPCPSGDPDRPSTDFGSCGLRSACTPAVQAAQSQPSATPEAPQSSSPHRQPSAAQAPNTVPGERARRAAAAREGSDQAGVYSDLAMGDWPKRKIYFEDVEIRGSRAHGLSCRVTLIKEGSSFIGESRGVDGDRARLELAARAACLAISDADGRDRQFGCEGIRMFDAFERRFVFVGVTLRSGRESRLLTGTCEVADSAETAAVLAVLDATNRWLDFGA